MKILKFAKTKPANLDKFPVITFEKKINGSWETFKQTAYKYILKNNFNNFLNWPIIQKTMFVNEANYLNFELDYLKKSSKKFLKILPEDLWGTPTPSELDRSTSGNRIHHSFLIAKYEIETNHRINEFKTIFEFGGGYGSFARLIHRLNFDGIYIIFDFDIFNIIQYNYLEKFGYNVYVQSDIFQGNGIYLFNDLSVLNKFTTNIKVDLFIATWSLSESDMATRNNIKNILSNSSHFLLAFQSEFDSIDNINYFTNLLSKQNVSINKLDHMGDGQNYLFI
jgi:hypothetical protein